MVSALPKNERSARTGARPSYPVLSRALGKSLRAMAGEHPRLVHQPPGVVGTPRTGVVPEIPNPKSQIPNRWGCLCRHQSTDRSGKLGPRSRHSRHMVFVVAMGVRDDG